MRNRVLFLLIIVCRITAPAFSDVIRTEDGTIFLGQVASAEGGFVTLDVFGKTIRLTSTALIKMETDYSALSVQPVEIILNDGSVIRGKVKNFDPDIGLFVDLDFGELTIPSDSIRRIQDPAQRNLYYGFPIHVGLTGGYDLTVGPLGASFGPGFLASAFAEVNLPIVRGLFAGLDISQFFVPYLAGRNLSYSVTTATACPIYRYLGFWSSSLPVIKNLVPWFGLGAGIAYIGVSDQAAGSSRGEIDLVYSANLGLDFYLSSRLLIRLGGRWLAVQQTSTLLHLPSVSIGAAYSF